VQKVVPAAELLDTALGLARRIAAQAPAAVVATRLNVLKAIELGQAAAVADFIPVQQRLASSEDAAEGVRSFIEKRPARFTGR
jgi:enoyl-CoA hydratase/carnithine racemase